MLARASCRLGVATGKGATHHLPAALALLPSTTTKNMSNRTRSSSLHLHHAQHRHNHSAYEASFLQVGTHACAQALIPGLGPWHSHVQRHILPHDPVCMSHTFNPPPPPHPQQARKANYQALTPLSFLERTAKLYPRRTAVAYRDETRTWKEEYLRIKKLGSSLYKAGVRPGRSSLLSPPPTHPPTYVPTQYLIH